jgi:hypothetical protein
MGRNDQKYALNAFKKRASCNSRAVSPRQRHFRVTHNPWVVGSSPTRPTAGYCSLTRHFTLDRGGRCDAAQQGATLADLQARLGHSTANAALLYQHTAKGRDQMVADSLSKLVSE